MARAKAERRTIVTADLDYPRLLAAAGAVEPSVVLFRDGNWSDVEVIARMAALLKGLSDIEQSIVVVEKNRVRRRRLPLGR